METRTCTKCGETKPLTEFYQRDDPARKQQSFSVCKPCILKQNDEYRAKHHLYRKKIERESKNRTMLKVFKKLSLDGEAKCAVCGFKDDYRLLQIDHKNDDGSKDLTKWGRKRTGAILQAKIIKMSDEEARASYQVLCIVHNWLKRYGETEILFTIKKWGT